MPTAPPHGCSAMRAAAPAASATSMATRHPTSCSVPRSSSLSRTSTSTWRSRSPGSACTAPPGAGASVVVAGIGDIDGDYAPDAAFGLPDSRRDVPRLQPARRTRGRPLEPARRPRGAGRRAGRLDRRDRRRADRVDRRRRGARGAESAASGDRLPAQPPVDVPVHGGARAAALPARVSRGRLARVQPEPGRRPDRALQSRARMRPAIADVPADRVPQRQRAHPRPGRRTDHRRDRRPRRLLRHAAGGDPARWARLLHGLRPQPGAGRRDVRGGRQPARLTSKRSVGAGPRVHGHEGARGRSLPCAAARPRGRPGRRLSRATGLRPARPGLSRQRADDDRRRRLRPVAARRGGVHGLRPTPAEARARYRFRSLLRCPACRPASSSSASRTATSPTRRSPTARALPRRRTWTRRATGRSPTIRSRRSSARTRNCRPATRAPARTGPR